MLVCVCACVCEFDHCGCQKNLRKKDVKNDKNENQAVAAYY